MVLPCKCLRDNQYPLDQDGREGWYAKWPLTYHALPGTDLPEETNEDPDMNDQNPQPEENMPEEEEEEEEEGRSRTWLMSKI